MNRNILKHIHSNMYLVVLGIYTNEKEDVDQPSMQGILTPLGDFQFKQLNIPVYLQPFYVTMSDVISGKPGVLDTIAKPAGVIVRVGTHLTTVMDFGIQAVVVVGLVRLFEPLQAILDNDSWVFSIRGMQRLFYSPQYPHPSRALATITGWDVFQHARSQRESFLLDKLLASDIVSTIVKGYDFLTKVEQHRETVIRALRSIETVSGVEDVSFQRDNRMHYTFLFWMDLDKAELLYRVFPPYLQLRVAHHRPMGESETKHPPMVCFLDVGGEDDLAKLTQYSLTDFL